MEGQPTQLAVLICHPRSFVITVTPRAPRLEDVGEVDGPSLLHRLLEQRSQHLDDAGGDLLALEVAHMAGVDRHLADEAGPGHGPASGAADA